MVWYVLGAALLASIVSLLLTRQTIIFSHRQRLLDKPEARKAHTIPTPRLGGIGIIGAALIVGVPMFLWLSDPSTSQGWETSKHYLALAVGAAFVFGVGVIDDLWGVASKLKLLTLLAASSVFCASGAGLNELVYDFEVFISFPWLSWILTAIWITGMAVAFNFIDGLDGLSAGLALITCATLGFFQLAVGNTAAAVAPMVVAGAIVGFLYYNRPPAKTFMGDGGSLTLGYLLGAMTLAANTDPKLGTMKAIIIPSLGMSVAILDSAVTMFRRRYEQRRSMFTAERGHIHHRLMDRGFNSKQTVLLIHGVSVLCVLIGICSIPFEGWATLGGLSLIVPVLWGLFHAAGSVRTNEMVSAVRRKRAIDRTSKQYRTAFEELQLEFDGARNFSHWWQVICNAAEQLHFSQIELPIEVTQGEPRTFRWVNSSDDFEKGCQRIDAKIPIPLFGVVGETANAEVRVPIVASLESAGERLALFSRLMAENGYEALRRINRQHAVEPSEQPTVEPSEFGHLRVAVVHDAFVAYAGPERVVEQLISIFPHCDLFGLVDFLPEQDRSFLRGKEVKTSFLQKLPFASSKPRAYLPLAPLAIEQLDVSSYDLVISSSHVVAKGVLTGPDQLHLCYCHSPARFAWDRQHDCLAQAGVRFGLRSVIARMALHYLRNWDVRAANGVDQFIASSRHVASWIAKTYRRDADVIYPAADTDAFTPDGSDRTDAYVVAVRDGSGLGLSCVIEAFKRSPQRKLVVLCEGAACDRINYIAGSNIEVYADADAKTIVSHLQTARAYLYAGDGASVAPIDAIACGTPVIAYEDAGVADSIPTGRGGRLIAKRSTSAVLEALEGFEEEAPLDEIDCKALRQFAERRSTRQFVERFSDLIRKAAEPNSVYNQTPADLTHSKPAADESINSKASETQTDTGGLRDAKHKVRG